MNKSKIYKNKKDDWHTPKEIVELFGHFDMDPCTTKDSAKRLEIKNYYTKRDNGLTKEWTGKVWLNPPFSNKEEWIKKARDYVNGGGEVFLLLPLSPETKIWHECILGNAIIYIPNKRISFLENGKSKGKGSSFTSVIVEMTKTRNYKYKTFKV